MSEPRAQSAPVHSFGFTRVGELGPLKPTQWLIKHYVETDSLALLFGDPGCGKSFLAVDMACAIATGSDWHGHKVRQGAVFYIAGEGLNNIQKRFRAWEIRHQIELADAPIFVSHHAAQFCTLDSAQEVSDAIRTLADKTGAQPVMIVIDTLARNFGGADENSTQDMNLFVTHLDGALKVPFKACVLVVHHTGHADKGRARGAMALKGALDAEYSLTKDSEGVVRLVATKMKDAPEPDALAFTKHAVELGLEDEDGEPVTSAVLNSSAYVPPAKAGKAGRGKHQTHLLRLLRELEARDGAELAGPLAARVTEDELRERLTQQGMNRYQFRDAKKALLDSGAIGVGDGGTIMSRA
jgi:hypothetical protein